MDQRTKKDEASGFMPSNQVPHTTPVTSPADSPTWDMIFIWHFAFYSLQIEDQLLQPVIDCIHEIVSLWIGFWHHSSNTDFGLITGGFHESSHGERRRGEFEQPPLLDWMAVHAARVMRFPVRDTG
jgi:hypothetical protein